MIRTVIVEDSRLARLELKELLRAHPEIEVIGEADSAAHALELIRLMSPELVFLDIHLPGGSGFDVLEQLEELPAVIFTTAFEQYALRSYDYQAADYLLKPIVPERLARALGRIGSSLTDHVAGGSPAGKSGRIFIKDQHRTWLVPLEDIRYFEAKGNYTQVNFAAHHPLILRALQQLEVTLSPQQFLRVNRQQIVNLAHITAVGPAPGNRLQLTLSDGTLIEVSRRQMARFKDLYRI